MPGRYEWVRVDRDGNEIPDIARSNNGEQDSQATRSEGARSDAGEVSGSETDDRRTDESA